MKAWIINKIGPFIVKYYKKDFDLLLKKSVAYQINAISKEVKKAEEAGVTLELHLDPTSLPIGLAIYWVSDRPKLSIVETDE